MSTPTPDAPTIHHAVAATSSADLPRIDGYEVLELVGRGGMGKVYRAKHIALGRTVAIKVMTHEGDERLLARFRDEARAVAKLQHPNIAQLFDTGTADGRPYYTLEFADGGTLARQWDGMPQDPRAAAAAVECVARAIQHSHEHGILHRDLKPGNVLLAADGTPKVADFGLAKELPSAAGATTLPGAGALTRTGEVVGTPAYMPPEQASGITSTLTPAADVYSLGAMLYEALTGRPPFTAPDPLQTLFLVLAVEPVPPKTLQPKLPPDLNTICLKCLEKAPKKRYATASELADDLHRWLAGEPIVARPVGRVERAVKWAKRHRAGAALVVLSGVFLLALVAFAVVVAVNAVQLHEANDQMAAKNRELEEVNRRLTEAKAESDGSFTLATATLDDTTRDLGVRLNGVPKAEGLMLDVLSKATDLYRRLVDLRPGDREAAGRYVRALVSRAVFETGFGRREAAKKTRAELDAFLKSELAKAPDDPDLRALELTAAADAATAAQDEDPPARAPALRATFAKLATRYAEQFPNRVEARTGLVRMHWYRGFDAADADGRVAAHADAVAEARRIPDTPGLPAATRFTFLASSLAQLGMMLEAADRLNEADEAYAEADKLYAAPPDPTCIVRGRAGLGEVKVKRASIAWTGRRFPAAYRLYTDAEPILRALVDDFPLTAEYRLSLSECLIWRATLLKKDNPDACRKLANDAVAVLDKPVEFLPANAAYKTQRDHKAELRDLLLTQLEKP